jgi:pyrimidine-nucleoside phosphorylase
MLTPDIIKKKRDGQVLSPEEIKFLVSRYVKGEVPDYQMSAFLMAVYFREMSETELLNFTLAMRDSGEKIDLSGIRGVKVDKHSTGGVGDTTTLICAPLASACGVPVAKMTGRGLGHTGGTADKLESIPGFSVELSKEAFFFQVNKIGISIMAQSQELVPADKKLYALRDVTATIDSLPLIASSVMSKKLAAGADAIVLDVKFGDGAFMKGLDAAGKLAEIMVKIGNHAGKRTAAFLTSMEQPLGNYIGNVLEVIEAFKILKGEEKKGDLRKVSVQLASCMVLLGGEAASFGEAEKKVLGALDSGKGLDKMEELIKAQGGDPRVVEDTALLPTAALIQTVCSDASGYVQAISAEAVGRTSLLLGAGRTKKEDKIDLSVGIILKKRVGDQVEKGEPLVEIRGNDPLKLNFCQKKIKEAYRIGTEPPVLSPLIPRIIL